MAGDNQEKATSLLSGIPFGYLIGAPLKAAIEAQSIAAMETVKFIEAVGFVEPTGTNVAALPSDSSPQNKGRFGVARTITFLYQKGEETYTLAVPLLTLVPIPFLRISNMNINFKANISAETKVEKKENSETDKKLNADGKLGFFFKSLDLKSSISNKSGSSTTGSDTYNVQYTMDISVNAVQDSMPGGMQQVLNILLSSATPKAVAAAAATSPPPPPPPQQPRQV